MEAPQSKELPHLQNDDSDLYEASQADSALLGVPTGV